MSVSNVKVVCRVRPQSDLEVARGGRPCVVATATGVDVVSDGTGEHTTFTFDRVYDGDASQGAVYDCVRAAVSDVFTGYNGTIFAYGQVHVRRSVCRCCCCGCCCCCGISGGVGDSVRRRLVP
jgi:hypothetical protein